MVYNCQLNFFLVVATSCLSASSNHSDGKYSLDSIVSSNKKIRGNIIFKQFCIGGLGI
jgi:hypothetical protein